MWHFLARLMKSERGSLMITFAFMLNVLILAVALPMDLGRGYMARSAISGAADAAAIASAVDGGSDAKAEAYFKSNLPAGQLGIKYNYATDVDHSVDPVTGDVTVKTSNFMVPAYFSSGTKNSGTVDVGDETIVGGSSSILESADFILVLDSSNSMQFLPKIKGGKVTSYNPVGIVSSNGVYKWEAVEAAALKFIDYIMSKQGVDKDGDPLYRIALISYNDSLKASYPFADMLSQLVSKFPAMIAPGGNTNAGIALQESHKDILNDDPKRTKIVVFMTDGQFNIYDGPSTKWKWPSDYTGVKTIQQTYPYSWPPQSTDTTAHRYAATQCNLLHQQPETTVWTIAFGTEANTPINRDVLIYCATDPSQKRDAKDGNELDDVFTQIAKTYTRIRIKK